MLREQLAQWASESAASVVAIPRRSVRRMNSALRDIGRGGDDTEVWIHPADASRNGIDDTVIVRTAAGSIQAPVRLTTDIVEGAISVPHGLEHANVNELTQTTTAATDRLSGMVTQSGFAVMLEAPVPARE